MSPLTATLAELRRRLRRAVAIRDVIRAAVLVGGGSAAIAAADALGSIHSPWFRFTAVLVVVLIALGLLVQLARRLRAGEWSLVRMALLLERVRPELRDRLAGAAELIAGPDSAAAAPPPRLLQSAAEALADFSPAHLVDHRPVIRAAAGLLGVLVVWTGWSLVAPAQAGLALQRVLTPFSAPDWPREVRLVLLDDRFEPLSGELRQCVADEPLTLYIENRLGRLPRDLQLGDADAPGADRTWPLTYSTRRDAHGRERQVAAATLTPHAGRLRLRAVGGDDRDMPWHEFDVRAAPRLERFRIQVVPPEYTQLPVTEDERSVGHVAGLIGSRVSVVAQSNIPLAEAVLHRGEHPAERVALAVPTELRWQFPITAEGRSTYWIDLRDEFGLSPAHPQKFEILGRRDQPPQLHWRQPTRSLTAVPNAVLPISATASDDFGLGSVTLEWTTPDQESLSGRLRLQPASAAGVSRPLPLQNTLDGTWSWELSSLHLLPGKHIECRLAAVDVRTPDPQRTVSPSVGVTIVSPEEKRRELDDRQSELAATIDRLVDRHAGLDVTLQELHTQALVAGTLRPADREQLFLFDRERRRTIGELSDEQTGVHGQIQHIGEQLTWNRLSEPATTARMARLETRLRGLLEIELTGLGRQLTVLQHAGELTPATDAARVPDADSAVDPDRFGAACAAVQQAHGAVQISLAAMQSDLHAWRRQAEVEQVLETVLAGQRDVRRQTLELNGDVVARDLADLTPQQHAALATLAARQRRWADFLDRLRTISGDGTPSTTPALPPPVADGVVVSRMVQAADDVAANRTFAAATTQAEVIAALEAALQRQTRAAPADRLQTLARLQQQATDLRSAYLVWQQGWQQRSGTTVDGLRRGQAELESRAVKLAGELAGLDWPSPRRTAAQAAAESRSLSAALTAEQADRVEAALGRVIAALLRLEQDVAEARSETEQAVFAEVLAALTADLQPLQRAQLEVLAEAQTLEDRRIAAGRRTRADLKQLDAAAESQQQLGRGINDLADRLNGAALPGIVLRQTGARMDSAAAGLSERRTDDAVLEDQRAAADLLSAVIAATAELDASADAGAIPGAAAAADPTGATRGVELNLLIALQRDLQSRTRTLQQQAVAQPESPELTARLQGLADEQTALAKRTAAVWTQRTAIPPTGSRTAEPE